MIEITIPFPPSANTYYRRGKFSTYLSPTGRKFKQAVSDIVATERKRIEGRLCVFMAIYPGRRGTDLDNRIKPTLDALQDSGVFDDDEQVDELHVIKKEVIKGGKCVIVITNVVE